MSKITVCFMKFFTAKHKYGGAAVNREIKRMLGNVSACLCLIAAILLFSGCGNSGETEYRKGEKAFRDKDYAEAVKWYRKAAECGYARAQGDLGQMYFSAPGYISREEAEKWLQKAARSSETGTRIVAESGLRTIDFEKEAEASRKKLARDLGMKESDL